MPRLGARPGNRLDRVALWLDDAAADVGLETKEQRRLPDWIALGALALGATLLLTWPLLPDAAGHVLAAPFYWDAYTNTMIMAGRVDAVLGRAPLSLYDNYFFAPLPHSIVFNENLFGLSLIFAPFYLLSGSPLLAYNLTLLTSLAASAWFTSLLVRRLTGAAWAGAIAGIAFAFCPYVCFELGRIQLVATQWIPACFLMLQRAVESRKWRDLAGLGACYLLQIGTCLYYAMFLLPLLGLLGSVLLLRERSALRVGLRLAVLRWAVLRWAILGVAVAALAWLMVHPYFSSRDAFDLERSPAFAGAYDGKLGFFANVHEGNRSLTALHHASPFRGAHEQVAFPGLTVVLLLLVSVVVGTRKALQELGARSFGVGVARWLGVVVVAVLASLFTHSLLSGAVVLLAGVWLQRRWGGVQLFAGPWGLYLAVALLAVVLFLGLTPLQFGGQPVRGLYYYLHAYFPGFNGIRKVSRQAVMTTFALAVLASYGSAWLLSRCNGHRWRQLLGGGLVLFAVWELRCFPHATKAVWAGDSVPEAYAFMATLPAQELVASIPQNAGSSVFRGDAGLAYHNYLMTLHKHRSVNGQSSWQPSATELADRALRALPAAGARRVLQSLGVAHLLVHGADLEPERRALIDLLSADSAHYQRVFVDGQDAVFSLQHTFDPTLELLDTPPLPAEARAIDHAALRATASVQPAQAVRAIDGDPQTAWSSVRTQASGDQLELWLDTARTLVAFEIENDRNLVQVPLSFELEVGHGEAPMRRVFSQPEVRVYRDLVFTPKHFVLRVVLPEPVVADRVRLTLKQALPTQPLTIAEARLYTNEP